MVVHCFLSGSNEKIKIISKIKLEQRKAQKSSDTEDSTASNAVNTGEIMGEDNVPSKKSESELVPRNDCTPLPHPSLASSPD